MFNESALPFFKVNVTDLAPTIAAEGELYFDRKTNRLMIYVNDQWMDAIPRSDTKIDFSIYLSSLPTHDVTIFKTIATQPMRFDSANKIIVTDSEAVTIEFMIDGTTQYQSVFECEKGACLSIVFKHNEKQTPSDLTISFFGVSLTS